MAATVQHEMPTVTCSDGMPLRAHLFRPPAANGRAIIVSPGTGIPCRFYFRFAEYLAEQGFTVLTWDWRGIADNRPASLRGFGATMMDWATLDQPAMIDWLTVECGSPLSAIGHSFGAQVFGLADRAECFERLVLLAAGTAWWKLWPAPGRYLFRLSIAVMETIAGIVGYLPGKAMGLGEDLPKGVALQWFHWAKQPRYHGQWSGARAIKAPVLSLGFSDDTYAPPQPRRWLLDQYGGEKSFETIAPRDAGLDRIGHLDFFRSRHRESLWPCVLDWLQ